MIYWFLWTLCSFELYCSSWKIIGSQWKWELDAKHLQKIDTIKLEEHPTFHKFYINYKIYLYILDSDPKNSHFILNLNKIFNGRMSHLEDYYIQNLNYI